MGYYEIAKIIKPLMNNPQKSLIQASHSAEFLTKEIRNAYYDLGGLPDSPSNRIAEKYLLGLIEDSQKIENALKYFVAKP